MSEEDREGVDIERERVRASARLSLLGGGERFRIGRFELVGWLGAGAMGFVYDALDTELHREVALKVLDQDLPLALRAERAARLLREAQALARVDHPNVVRIHEVGRDHGHVFLAMEKLRGTKLDEWLRDAPTEDLILDVLRGVGRGLAAVHARGLAHRDFKPGNVMVSAGRGVLVDFGLVRAIEPMPADSPLEQTLTRTGVKVGTPAYMSPEQLRGEPGDARSDQFAFCVVLFEALLGRRPYEGVNPADLAATMAEGAVDGTGLAAELRAVLLRGLATDPRSRFASMDDLLDALEARPARHVADRYELGERLGAGGSGAVYRAYDRTKEEDVALKILKRERDLGLLRDVMRVRHPSLVELRDVGVGAGSVYIAMELIEGPTLRQRLDDLTPPEVVRIVSAVAEALAALHAAGFVHRDVKPDNILLQGSRVVLVDLDLASEMSVAPNGDASRNDAARNDVRGTTPYLAPEQARGHALSPATDQFALAVTAYEALVGKRPWTGDATRVMAKLAVESPTPPTRERPEFPKAVDAVLLRALAKNPGERFPDVRSFAHALRSSFSRRVQVLALGLVAALGVAAGAYAVQSPHPLADDESVLACPIFEVQGIAPPSAWLGAAAADLACHRASWSLGGRSERTRVPAELLDLDPLGGDDFPSLPFDAPGATEATRERSRESNAWIDGRVELRDWELEVTLSLRSGERVLGAGRGRSGLLVSAVNHAMAELEESSAIPREPLDPRVAELLLPESNADPELGWLAESIRYMSPQHPEMESACERLFDAVPPGSPLLAHTQDLCSAVIEPAELSTPVDSSSELVSLAMNTEVDPPHDLETKLEAERAEAERAESSRALVASTLAAAQALVRRRRGDQTMARALWFTALTHDPRAHWMRDEAVRECVGNSSLAGIVRSRPAWDPAAAFGYVQSAWWGDHDVDTTVDLMRRAHVLARYDAPVSVHVISAMLTADRVDDAQIVAAELAANPSAAPSARAVGEVMVDALAMRVGRALERLKEALGRVDRLHPAFTGDVVAVLFFRKLSELLGREREVADWFVDTMVPDHLPRSHGYLSMPIVAICMHASPPGATRCLDRVDAMDEVPLQHRVDGLDDFVRGARAYAADDIHRAVEAWRGLPSSYYFAENLPAHAFDEAGEPELALRCTEVQMSRQPFAGLSRAQPALARRTAERDPARARELAQEVVEAWSQADVRIPAVEEMRVLLQELMLDPDEP